MAKQENIFEQFRSYNGNPNLKRVGVRVRWTEEMVDELVKCSEDIIYFVEKYVKIVTEDGLKPFILYDYQKEMLLSMANNRFTIITTARQSGKSTVTTAFILWFILFNEYKTVGLLANKEATALEIFSKVQLAYQFLPKWMQQGVVEWRKGGVELENGSRVIAAATSSDAIRGYTLHMLFIDEAAFIDNWDTFFTSVFPTITAGKTTKVVLVSTPNGLNHFHKIWENALAGKNDYTAIRVHWTQVPGRDEEWKRMTLSGMNGDHEKFEQEYSCEFMGSSGTLVSGWRLKEMFKEWDTPSYKKDGLSKYVEPSKGRNYVLVADSSKGRGLDYSAFSILDITQMPYVQVCTYKNNLIAPIDYAEVIYRVAKSYNDASVLVEVNNMGDQVASSLQYDFEYENILYTENAGRLGKKITSGFGKNVDRGINTTKPVKATGCSILKLLIEQHQLVIKDYDTIQELSTFSKKGISYEAEPGNHDDMVMTLVPYP